MHYGVMGMHWGIRRYQPYPAAYDGDGKYIGDKALKKKVKADKRAVDKAVREASILGAAVKYGSKKVAKANARLKKASVYDSEKKSPEYDEARRKDHTKAWNDATSKEFALEGIEAAYEKAEKKAQKMVSDLKRKYGDQNIRDLKYEIDSHGNKVINERVVKVTDWIKDTFDRQYLGALDTIFLPIGKREVVKSRWNMGRDRYREALKDTRGIMDSATGENTRSVPADQASDNYARNYVKKNEKEMLKKAEAALLREMETDRSIYADHAKWAVENGKKPLSKKQLAKEFVVNGIKDAFASNDGNVNIELKPTDKTQYGFSIPTIRFDKNGKVKGIAFND